MVFNVFKTTIKTITTIRNMFLWIFPDGYNHCDCYQVLPVISKSLWWLLGHDPIYIYILIVWYHHW